MNKIKTRNIIISISIAVTLVVAGSLLYYGTDWFKPGSNQTNYTWETDPQRLTFPESITNVTLNISYGVGNSNINESFSNLNFGGHYTTVFDILNSLYAVEFEIHWWNNPTYFITGINGTLENESLNRHWLYEINGSYVPAGANAICPGNNSIVRWFYE